jgi:hypothetical protein
LWWAEPTLQRLNRGEAFRQAAETNAHHLPAKPGALPDYWAVVLELGEPIECPTVTETVFAGSLGVESRQTFRPVRIVTASAEEVTQAVQAETEATKARIDAGLASLGLSPTDPAGGPSP